MSRKLLVSNTDNVLSLRHATYLAAREYPGGIARLAFDMGVTYEYLQKRVHINDNGYRLTLEDLEKLIELTKDDRVIAAILRPIGAFACHPEPKKALSADLGVAADILEVKGKFLRSLRDALKDGRFEQHEVDELNYIAAEISSLLFGITAGAQELVVTSGAENDA